MDAELMTIYYISVIMIAMGLVSKTEYMQICRSIQFKFNIRKYYEFV